MQINFSITLCCCYCSVASVVSNSVQPHRRQPTRLPNPWDSPGKNTGVGCRFLLQCRKVKSESEVAQSCPTLSNPMDCSLPGSSIHGIFQARVLEWGAIALSAVDFKFLKDKIQGQIFESEQQLKIILHPHVRISTTLKMKKKTQTKHNRKTKQNKKTGQKK